MIDSVWLTLPIRMHSPREMTALGFMSTCKHAGPECSHPARWHLRSATNPQLTWSEAPDHSHWLSVSGSLPKFMFGSNVRLITNEQELKRSLVALSEFVSDVTHANFDAFLANVSRVDYCHDWQLTSGLVNEYLWALRDISLARMEKHLIDNSTVELRNKAKSITFYDKFKERTAMRLKNRCSKEEVLAARGVLRFEVRFKDNRSCQRHAERMGVGARTAKSLFLGDVAHRTITGTLERLGLDKPIVSGPIKYQLLHHYCKGDGAKYVRLAGFLTLAQIHGLENLVPLGICSYSDYRRKLAELKAAGVLYAQEKGRGNLPPLRIDAFSLPEAIQVA